MSESKQNTSPNFKSKEEAFEFLVEQSQNKALKDQWKAELDKLPDVQIVDKGQTKVILIKRVMAIAATFIILFGSFYWFTLQDNSPSQMADMMIKDTNFILESGSITRGNMGEVNDEVYEELRKEINSALEKENYVASIGLFFTVEKESQLTLADKFYYSLSLARVEDADYQKALSLLDEVISQKGKYYDEALWLQALLYLKTGEPQKTKIILHKLINKSNYQNTNSKALLKKMAD